MNEYVLKYVGTSQTTQGFLEVISGRKCGMDGNAIYPFEISLLGLLWRNPMKIDGSVMKV